MKIINVKTGLGYLKKSDGEIVVKYDLPIGKHPISDELDFVECADKAALDLIEVSTRTETPDRIRENKIQVEMRSMAIKNLELRGEI